MNTNKLNKTKGNRLKFPDELHQPEIFENVDLKKYSKGNKLTPPGQNNTPKSPVTSIKTKKFHKF
jgi:hypothetical protein